MTDDTRRWPTRLFDRWRRRPVRWTLLPLLATLVLLLPLPYVFDELGWFRRPLPPPHTILFRLPEGRSYAFSSDVVSNGLWYGEVVDTATVLLRIPPEQIGLPSLGYPPEASPLTKKMMVLITSIPRPSISLAQQTDSHENMLSAYRIEAMPDQYGLRVTRQIPKSGNYDTYQGRSWKEFFRHFEGSTLVVSLDCSGEDTVPNPQCTLLERFDSVQIQASFPRRYLVHWKITSDALKTFIRSSQRS